MTARIFYGLPFSQRGVNNSYRGIFVPDLSESDNDKCDRYIGASNKVLGILDVKDTVDDSDCFSRFLYIKGSLVETDFFDPFDPGELLVKDDWFRQLLDFHDHFDIECSGLRINTFLTWVYPTWHLAC